MGDTISHVFPGAICVTGRCGKGHPLQNDDPFLLSPALPCATCAAGTLCKVSGAILKSESFAFDGSWIRLWMVEPHAGALPDTARPPAPRLSVEEVRRLKALETARYVSVGYKAELGPAGEVRQVGPATMRAVGHLSIPRKAIENDEIREVMERAFSRPANRFGPHNRIVFDESAPLPPTMEAGPGISSLPPKPAPIDDRPYPLDEDLLA